MIVPVAPEAAGRQDALARPVEARHDGDRRPDPAWHRPDGRAAACGEHPEAADEDDAVTGDAMTRIEALFQMSDAIEKARMGHMQHRRR